MTGLRSTALAALLAQKVPPTRKLAPLLDSSFPVSGPAAIIAQLDPAVPPSGGGSGSGTTTPPTSAA